MVAFVPSIACLPGTLVHNSGEAVRGARMHSKISREVAIACFQLVTGVFLPCNLNNLTRCRLWKDCVILRDGVCRCVKVTLNQIARLLREQLKNVAWSSLALRLNGWRLCPQSICSTRRRSAWCLMVPHSKERAIWNSMYPPADTAAHLIHRLWWKQSDAQIWEALKGNDHTKILNTARPLCIHSSFIPLRFQASFSNVLYNIGS